MDVIATCHIKICDMRLTPSLQIINFAIAIINIMYMLSSCHFLCMPLLSTENWMNFICSNCISFHQISTYILYYTSCSTLRLLNPRYKFSSRDTRILSIWSSAQITLLVPFAVVTRRHLAFPSFRTSLLEIAFFCVNSE